MEKINQFNMHRGQKKSWALQTDSALEKIGNTVPGP